MTFKCLFSGHRYEQFANLHNSGTWFLCPICGSTKWCPNIEIKGKTE